MNAVRKTQIRFVFTAALVVATLSCSKDGANLSAPVKPQLPAPFTALRLGDTLAAINKSYPPLEDTSDCAPKFVGGEERMAALVPGAEKNPRSYCARAREIAGLSDPEFERLFQAASEGESNNTAAHEVMAALTYTAAQVRGSLRAGTIGDAEVFDASGSTRTAYDAVLDAVGKLYDGSARFLKPMNARRIVCAVVAEDCIGLDANSVREYVMGEYSLRTLDREAHKRVANSKCRGPYLRAERAFKRQFAIRTGGLAGIGLAKAVRKDRGLDPAEPSTYTTFSSRSRLDANAAELGVRIANALPDSEKFWRGAVVLAQGETKEPWGPAIVWFARGAVSQILVNIDDEQKLADLPALLTELYGKPESMHGSVTRWALDSGNTAILDIGGAASLLVSSAKGNENPSSIETAGEAGGMSE